MSHLLALAGKGAVLDLLAPKGLLLLLLLVPLVVLYILKVKRHRKRVASTWLWATAQRDLMARSPFKRLIAQIPLILQGIALVALALALSRPATRGREFTGDHVAIVIDASASMSAAAPGVGPEPTTRLALAKEAAKDILSALTPGSDALILQAGREAHLLSPLDRDIVRVKAAVDRVHVEDVEGDLGAAVALAVDRLRQMGGSRRIVVLTDGNLARPHGLAGAALPIEVITVGVPVDNTAIVRVDVRSGTDTALNKEQVQAFLVVANFGKAAREVYVTMREQNASDVLASRRILVQPGERSPVELTFHPSPGDYRKGLLFEISPHDAMPVDDVAYGRVPAGDKLPIHFAGSSPWIERALVSDPMIDLHLGKVEALATDTSIGLDTLVVIEGACPASPPGGDLLIVNPPPGKCGGTMVGATIEHPEITSWENGDARMRFLTLDGVHILRANALKPDGMSQELIRSQQGTIATDISTTTRTGTLLGFDVGDSDWPARSTRCHPLDRRDERAEHRMIEQDTEWNIATGLI
ncbi:MAG: VWA domain-containing protein, partial [Minicystis sp.]